MATTTRTRKQRAVRAGGTEPIRAVAYLRLSRSRRTVVASDEHEDPTELSLETQRASCERALPSSVALSSPWSRMCLPGIASTVPAGLRPLSASNEVRPTPSSCTVLTAWDVIRIRWFSVVTYVNVRRAGGRVLSATEDLGGDGAMASLLRTVYGLSSAIELERIRERVNRSLDAKYRQTQRYRPTWRPPYGYTRAVATTAIGDRVSIATTFAVSFARPVDPATVATAIWLDPMTSGVVKASDPADGPTHYTFVPDEPLLPDTIYQLHVAGVRDTDGLSLDAMTLSVRTASSPAVVRFRPGADSTNVDRAAPISVRFSKPMERRSTARAFNLSVAAKPIAGAVRWAERDTVLIFTPASPLPYGATVSMDVAAGARDVAGAALAMAAHATFTTTAKPSIAPAPATPKAPSPTTTAVGGGSWAAVETYYLGLMNCTRTGGWVTSTGKCSSPGGRNVAPLKLDNGISSKVSRPYAKKLAIGADCSHFIGGNPGDRLRRAGYTSYRWAENLGCRSGNPYAAVLGSHLFFQSEKSYNGGHYVNLMNAKYDRVGIGVWVSGGRVRLVIDFYHP